MRVAKGSFPVAARDLIMPPGGLSTRHDSTWLQLQIRRPLWQVFQRSRRTRSCQADRHQPLAQRVLGSTSAGSLRPINLANWHYIYETNWHPPPWVSGWTRKVNMTVRITTITARALAI